MDPNVVVPHEAEVFYFHCACILLLVLKGYIRHNAECYGLVLQDSSLWPMTIDCFVQREINELFPEPVTPITAM